MFGLKDLKMKHRFLFGDHAWWCSGHSDWNYSWWCWEGSVGHADLRSNSDLLRGEHVLQPIGPFSAPECMLSSLCSAYVHCGETFLFSPWEICLDRGFKILVDVKGVDSCWFIYKCLLRQPTNELLKIGIQWELFPISDSSTAPKHLRWHISYLQFEWRVITVIVIM